jgi:hypothetical protein
MTAINAKEHIMQFTKSPLFTAGSTIAALMLASQVAFAAPPPPPGGHGVGGLAGLLLSAELHTTLALNATQEAQWQQLKADETTLQTALETQRQATRALVDAELARTAPDLVVIVGIFEDGRDDADALIQVFQQKALTFYGSLTAAQKALVISAFKLGLQLADRGHPGTR